MTPGKHYDPVGDAMAAMKSIAVIRPVTLAEEIAAVEQNLRTALAEISAARGDPAGPTLAERMRRVALLGCATVSLTNHWLDRPCREYALLLIPKRVALWLLTRVIGDRALVDYNALDGARHGPTRDAGYGGR